jgi:hypothetical protein
MLSADGEKDETDGSRIIYKFRGNCRVARYIDILGAGTLGENKIASLLHFVYFSRQDLMITNFYLTKILHNMYIGPINGDVRAISSLERRESKRNGR